ncbi:MAG: hypothetical protein AAGD35_16255 [Actinomycetota bacterium]
MRDVRPTEAGLAAIETVMLVALIAIVAVGGIVALSRTMAHDEGDLGTAGDAIDTQTIDGDSPDVVSGGGGSGGGGSGGGSGPAFNSAAGGISNGTPVEGNEFEDGSSRTWTNYTVGQTIGPWTVIEGNVDTHRNTSYQFGSGERHIDVNGFVPGAIEQKVEVTPGLRYTLRVNLAGATCSPYVTGLGIDWNGERVSTLTVDLRRGTSRVYEVDLPPSNTTEASLIFRGIGGRNCGVLIDTPSLRIDRS